MLKIHCKHSPLRASRDILWCFSPLTFNVNVDLKLYKIEKHLNSSTTSTVTVTEWQTLKQWLCTSCRCDWTSSTFFSPFSASLLNTIFSLKNLVSILLRSLPNNIPSSLKTVNSEKGECVSNSRLWGTFQYVHSLLQTTFILSSKHTQSNWRAHHRASPLFPKGLHYGLYFKIMDAPLDIKDCLGRVDSKSSWIDSKRKQPMKRIIQKVNKSEHLAHKGIWSGTTTNKREWH